MTDSAAMGVGTRDDVTPPPLVHVADLAIHVGTPREVGETGAGQRRIIDILGGTVSGPRLAGRILPGGADYQIIRAGGLTELHARYVVELDNGALVYVENTGLRFGPLAELDKIRRGEPVDPALIYFRTVPRFETAAEGHAWLGRHVFLGAGIRRPDRVEIRVFQVM